jgi:hypothetical protein
MTSLDKTLREIEGFLDLHPNASVRIKFDNSDNYRHFPSEPVTNDTFCDTCVFQNGLI